MQDIEAIKADLKDPQKRADAFTKLEKFSPARIKEALADEYLALKAADVKPFPKVQHAWDEYTTVQFQEPLNSKNVDFFKQTLWNVYDVETIEKLIRQLVFRIGDSRFEGKYEDMLEACLIELMKFSDLKEGLKLAPELLRECLAIVNRYFSTDNIIRFLLSSNQAREGISLYRFMLRRLRNPEAFQDFDKIREVIFPLDYVSPRYTSLGLQHVLNTNVCSFDARRLFDAFRQNPRMAEHLLKQYAYEIDVNAVVNGSSILLILVNTCVATSSSEKHSARERVEEYVKVIDLLLKFPELVVTREDLEAARKMNSACDSRPTLYGRLHEVFVKCGLRKVRAAISVGVTPEESDSVNACVQELDNDIRQLELQEKMQLCSCKFLTDDTKRFLIQNFPFGYYLMFYAVDENNMPETFMRLEALFALGAFPWERSADGIYTLFDYATVKELPELYKWLEQKENEIRAQSAFVKTFAEVPAAAAAGFGSPAHPSGGTSTNDNSNNDEVVTAEKKLTQ